MKTINTFIILSFLLIGQFLLSSCSTTYVCESAKYTSFNLEKMDQRYKLYDLAKTKQYDEGDKTLFCVPKDVIRQKPRKVGQTFVIRTYFEDGVLKGVQMDPITIESDMGDNCLISGVSSNDKLIVYPEFFMLSVIQYSRKLIQGLFTYGSKVM